MVNLLSLEWKKDIRRDYRNRYLVIIGFLILMVLVCLLVLNISIWFSLSIRERALHHQLVGDQINQTVVQQFERDLVLARQTSEQIKVLTQLPGPRESLGRLVDKIISHKISTVKLQTINYIREGKSATINLSGSAATRQGLLDFVAALRADPELASVESPISNLISDQNARFDLKLVLSYER